MRAGRRKDQASLLMLRGFRSFPKKVKPIRASEHCERNKTSIRPAR